MLARTVGEKMAERLGQPVVIDNRPGANGIIGAEAVARAPADGYTLAFHTLSSAVLNAGLYRSLPFDARRAFAPVSLVGLVPNVVVVNPRLPAATLREHAARAAALREALAGEGVSVSRSSVDRYLKARGLTRKKRQRTPPSRSARMSPRRAMPGASGRAS